MEKKGKLVICGGNISVSAKKIFTRFAQYATLDRTKIVVVVSASDEPIESFDATKDKLISVGVPKEDIFMLPLFDKEVATQLGLANARHQELLDILSNATGVWFTGGSQLRTTALFLNEDFTDTIYLKSIRQVLVRGGVIGGSSAGAAIMSKVMIGNGTDEGCLAYPPITCVKEYFSDKSNEEHEKLLITKGLGFFDGGIIDQHFNTRARQRRLITTMKYTSTPYGYGISEDTGLIYNIASGAIEVLGSAYVYKIVLADNETTIERITENAKC
ncbi:MAG: cyanophycinase [Clostridia bacterium]